MVVALIDCAVIGNDLGGGDLRLDECRELAERIVLGVAADVEDFACNVLHWGHERRHDGSRHIINMHEWPPLVRPEDGDDAIADSLRTKKVGHEIEPCAPGNAVD